MLACSVEQSLVYPANTRHSPNVGSILAHRLRRCANDEPTLVERIVLAGYVSNVSPVLSQQMVDVMCSEDERHELYSDTLQLVFVLCKVCNK